MESYTKEPLNEQDVVLYLKTTRTGSSTTRKCLYVGEIIGFTEKSVKILRLSKPDVFIEPHESVEYGVDTIMPQGIVNVLISQFRNKYEENK